MNRPIVTVSLKMYFERPRTLEYARSLVDLVGAERGLSDAVRLAVLPDFLTIAETGAILDGSGILLGAQDLCQDDRGARTGDSTSQGIHIERAGLRPAPTATHGAKTGAMAPSSPHLRISRVGFNPFAGRADMRGRRVPPTTEQSR